MMKTQQYVFTSDAKNYLKKELSKGHQYAKRVLNILPIDNGSVITYLPSLLIPEAYNFNDSILGSIAEEENDGHGIMKESQRIMLDFMMEYLQSCNGCAVFETIAYPTDPIIHKRNLSYFTFEKWVYLLLYRQILNKDTLYDYWEEAHSYPKIVGLSGVSFDELLFENNRVVSNESMELMVNKTEYLLIGAYDGDGYLIWKK